MVNMMEKWRDFLSLDEGTIQAVANMEYYVSMGERLVLQVMLYVFLQKQFSDKDTHTHRSYDNTKIYFLEHNDIN